MLFDTDFLKEGLLARHLHFSTHFDPFLLRPAMHLERKTRTEDEDIFLELIRPNEVDMDKITRALIVVAE
jgi:hypothetical protein